MKETKNSVTLLLIKIIEEYGHGSQVILAKSLKIKKQQLNAWVKGRENIPLPWVFKLEKFTKGKFNIFETLLNEQEIKYCIKNKKVN